MAVWNLILTFAHANQCQTIKLNANEKKIRAYLWEIASSDEKFSSNACKYQSFSLPLPMSTRRERAKAQNRQTESQLSTVTGVLRPQENQRKEKLANFLIDVAKYVFTGVIITSLFNDVSDKTILYVVGMGIVVSALWGGLLLTSKRKEK